MRIDCDPVLERELRRAGVTTVGGLFQGITVESDGIRPLTYGSMSIDPEGPARWINMEFEGGTWVQHVGDVGSKVPVAEPSTVIGRRAAHVTIQDFTPVDEGDRAGIKRLCYLVTCFGVVRNSEFIEFSGEWTAIAAKVYPATIDSLVAIGYWGSPGAHRLSLELELRTGRQVVLEEDLAVPHPIEVFDVAVEAHLAIDEPGPAFLECLIDGQLLGRRALYFSHQPPALDPTDARAVGRMMEEQRLAMDRHADPYLDTHVTALSYWSVCGNAVCEPNVLRFEREVQAIYWKEYPLAFRTTFAAGFRTRPGKHQIRVDLVNAATRAIEPGTTASVEADSNMSLVRAHGEVIVRIPAPGWYFFNLYVDESLTASSLICAETDKVRYSYSLLPQDVARVAAGELLVIGRRSKSADELGRLSGGESSGE